MMIVNGKMRRTSPQGKVALAPSVMDTKQSSRRQMGSQSARRAAHTKYLLKEVSSSPSRGRPLFEDEVDEASEVRALIQKAAERQVAKKAGYLRRCVEDTARQPNPKPDYFTTVQRNKITPEVRANIVTWLLRCSEMFQLLPETQETAVYFLDRLLSAAYIPTEKHVRIVAATCMLVAAKTCEQQGQGITIRDLVRACGAVFSANDIQRMERVILSKFGWSFLGKVVTPYTILTALMDVAPFVHASKYLSTDLQEAAHEIITASLSAPWYLDFSVVEITCGAVRAVLVRNLDDHALKRVTSEMESLARVDIGAVDRCARKMRIAAVEDVPMV